MQLMTETRQGVVCRAQGPGRRTSQVAEPSSRSTGEGPSRLAVLDLPGRAYGNQRGKGSRTERQHLEHVRAKRRQRPSRLLNVAAGNQRFRSS